MLVQGDDGRLTAVFGDVRPEAVKVVRGVR
jgi:hypothetical protein